MLKQTASTLLTAVQTRIALLGNEIQVEKHRTLRRFALVLALVFCLGLTVAMLVGLLLVLWWNDRATVLIVCAALFAALAAAFYRILRVPAEPVFAASLAELQEDLRQLKAATDHAEKAS